MQPPESEDVKGLFDQACTTLLSNDFGGAEDAFRRLSQQGHHPAVSHNLALAIELQGRFDEAATVYETNIATFPEHVYSYIGLANCERYLEKYEAAEATLKRAIGTDPTDCRPHILLSELYFYLGPHDYNEKAIDAHLFSLYLATRHGSQQTQHYAQAYYCNGDSPIRYHMFAEGSLLAMGVEGVTEKLSRSLQLHTIEEDVIVAMICTAGYVDLTRNCLLSKQRASVGEKTVVLCLDDVAMKLQEEFPDVVFALLRDIIPVKCIASFYNSQTFNRIVALKSVLVSVLLQAEKTVVFCDGDVVWLKDTLQDLITSMRDSDHELSIQLETTEPRTVYCSGFFIALPTPGNLHLFDAKQQPPMCGGEQPVINHLLPLLNIRVTPLDVSVYPNGLAWHKEESRPDDPAIVHYNFCLATEKPQLMRQYGHWLVPTHTDYQARIIQETSVFRPEGHVNRGHGGHWIEQAFFNHWTLSCGTSSHISTPLIYLPVFWTDVYAHDVSREALESYVAGLSREHRYFTVLQNAHGLMVDVPPDLQIVAFSAGTDKLPSNIHVIPIPLLKEELPLNTLPPSFDVCFVGCLTGASDREGLRSEMHSTLSNDSGYHYYMGAEWRRHMAMGRFNLCPSGFGPTSFRLYETLQLGRVPIYIHVDPQPFLPYKEFVPWHRICCFVPRSRIQDIPELLKSADYDSMVEEVTRCRKYFTYEYVVHYIASTVKHMTALHP